MLRSTSTGLCGENMVVLKKLSKCLQKWLYTVFTLNERAFLTHILTRIFCLNLWSFQQVHGGIDSLL